MANDLFFKHLLDSLNTAVVIADNQLGIQHLNTSAEVLLGVSAAQVTATPITRYFYESDTALSELQNAAEKARTFTKRKAQWQLPNKRQLTVDYTVSPLGNNHGILLEIQPLSRLLRISREEGLISAQETTRNLVRRMAHEIKNPLGGIRGAAQLLQRQLPHTNLEEYTKVIIAETDRLCSLVDRMLGPRQLPQWEQVNIHEVLERVATVVAAEGGESLHIDRDYDPSIPDLRGDKEQLVQAVLNVVRNALQALQGADSATGACIKLQTRIQHQFTIGRRSYPLVVRINIVDNGPGISAELVDNIFYPMTSGRDGGSGLGLAIAQQLIGQHHGIIECESRPQHTQFSLYIPLGYNSVGQENAQR